MQLTEHEHHTELTMHTELARWPSFSHKPTGEVSQGDAYSYASFDALAQRYTPFGVPARKTLWSQVPSKVAASLLTTPHLQVMLA